MSKCVLMTVAIASVMVGHAQTASTPQTPSAAAAPVERRDPVLDAASALVGRPLFLRCFCADNNLSFDANGKPIGAVKATDWTVAAMNVLKVERKGPGVVELDGVRVAVAYNATAREFQRHPQNDDKMHVTIAAPGADAGDAKAFRRTIDEVFAVGIELRLQRAMPEYWQHYFDPKLAWPAGSTDALSGVPVYAPGPDGLVVGTPVPAPGVKTGPPVSQPEVAHKASAQYTSFAQRDHVQGKTQVRFVVDAQGLPHQVAITQPQGYGLDERAAESVMKMRFTPAMREGKPVAAMVLLNQDFEIVETPR